MPVASMPLQRKKSLPDVAGSHHLTATSPLSREEVSVLSSMRREEVRRQIDERERLRANPFLYLVSPQVKVSHSYKIYLIIIIGFFYFYFVKLIICFYCRTGFLANNSSCWCSLSTYRWHSCFLNYSRSKQPAMIISIILFHEIIYSNY